MAEKHSEGLREREPREPREPWEPYRLPDPFLHRSQLPFLHRHSSQPSDSDDPPSSDRFFSHSDPLLFPFPSPSDSDDPPSSDDSDNALYRRALAEGEAKIAYSRVLFLGTAGVGKTSFKRSLMKFKWDEKDCNSTIISDISHIRPFSHKWHVPKEEQWQEVTHEEEIEEIAQLMSAVYKDNYEALFSLEFHSRDSHSSEPDSKPIDDVMKSKLEKIILEAIERARVGLQDLTPRPFLHFWDCGGQPAFLEILPAFLTSRTMFLLHFDASKSLRTNWQSVHHIRGTRFEGEEVNMTTLNHMLNWMANIHGHLMKYNEDRSVSEYPRMYCIGTHGDLLCRDGKQQVKAELERHYRGKDYAMLIEGTLIVDNTSSGKGDSEDPCIGQMREAIVKFTEEKLIVKTPISWVLFRKFLQVLEENVISLNMACRIGIASKIPHKDLPTVLLFYHDLGAVLYYPDIPELKNIVIVNPKYFVDSLGKLFTIEDSSKYGEDWKKFHRHGIVVQRLYVTVWKDCKSLKPEMFIEVLVHFRLAVEVTTNLFSSHFKQYFIPAVLKLFPGDVSKPSSHHLNATPLHITFQTGFVPPGFFTRFVAVIVDHSKMELFLDQGVYRNRVTFRYHDTSNRSIEHVIVTDHHTVIQIDVFRPTSHPDPVHLQNVCRDLLILLEQSAQEVERVLQGLKGRGFEELPKYSITRKLCYVCANCPPSSELHYLRPLQDQTSDLHIVCTDNLTRYRPLIHQEKVWFKHSRKIEQSETCPPAISYQLPAKLTAFENPKEELEVEMLRSTEKCDQTSLLRKCKSKYSPPVHAKKRDQKEVSEDTEPILDSSHDPSCSSTAKKSSAHDLQVNLSEVERNDPTIAHKVLQTNVTLIKESNIDCLKLADKLREEKIISDDVKRKVYDEMTGHTADRRLGYLLDAVIKTAKQDGTVFDMLITFLREEDTRLCIRAAKTLEEKYDELASEKATSRHTV